MLEIDDIHILTDGDIEQISEIEESIGDLNNDSESIEDKKEGLFYDMSNKEYHSRDGISSTQFSDLTLSVAVFNNRHIFNGVKGCYNIGDLNHVSLLEPHKLDIFMESITQTFDTKATLKMIEDNPDKTIVPLGSIRKADERAKKVMLIFGKYLNSSKKEVSIIVWDESIKMYRKARTDIWMMDNGIILDYKTSKEDNPKSFEKSIEMYDYDLSASWYIDTVNLAIDRLKLDIPKVHSFGWIVSPNSKPHKPFGMICSQELLEKGRSKYTQRLDKLIQVNQEKEKDYLFHDAHSWEYRKEN